MTDDEKALFDAQRKHHALADAVASQRQTVCDEACTAVDYMSADSLEDLTNAVQTLREAEARLAAHKVPVIREPGE